MEEYLPGNRQNIFQVIEEYLPGNSRTSSQIFCLKDCHLFLYFIYNSLHLRLEFGVFRVKMGIFDGNAIEFHQ